MGQKQEDQSFKHVKLQVFPMKYIGYDVSNKDKDKDFFFELQRWRDIHHIFLIYIPVTKHK